MTKDEALKMALECAERCESIDGIDWSDTIDAIKEALAQPKQELVGDEWTPCLKLPFVVHVRQQRRGETHVSTREGITPAKPDDLIMRGVEGEEYPIGSVLFLKTYTFDTSPPKREWVGLTDEKIRLDAHNADSGDWNDDRYQKFWHEGFKEGARGAESMLKESNT